MHKVFQTKFGKEGNCFSACIASILELNLEDVPCYLEEKGVWYLNYKKWLSQFDLDFVAVTGWDEESTKFIPEVYGIVSGDGSRGLEHATVYLGKNMVHDPHPNGCGIKNLTDWIYIVSKYPKKGGK